MDSLSKRWFHFSLVMTMVVIFLAFALKTKADCFGNQAFVVKQKAIVQECVVAPAAVVVQDHYVAPVSPVVNYFVGAPVRMEAMIHAELRNDPEYREFQQFKVWKQQSSHTNDACVPDYPDHPAEPKDPTGPIFSQTQFGLSTACLKCHSGPEPKAGLDMTKPMSAEMLLKATEQVASGAMPPEKNITTEQRLVLLAELTKQLQQ